MLFPAFDSRLMNTRRSRMRRRVAFAMMALLVARDAVPAHFSRYSGNDFVEHELCAIRALTHFLNTNCCGIVRVVASCSGEISS